MVTEALFGGSEILYAHSLLLTLHLAQISVLLGSQLISRLDRAEDLVHTFRGATVTLGQHLLDVHPSLVFCTRRVHLGDAVVVLFLIPSI
ncbi:Uncharacterised protein [Mycolicibacterium smegmatis]|nr:hypothetical protein [Mycolicibacterium smegmatis]SUA32854.1 Uncharacterised protein [Mycolicibacterium smegmatis]